MLLQPILDLKCRFLLACESIWMMCWINALQIVLVKICQHLPNVGSNINSLKLFGQFDTTVAGTDFRGGRTWAARPLYFFFFFFTEIGRLTFVWAPQTKWMHQIVQIDFENCKIFSASEGVHPPQTPLVPTGVKVLSVINLGAPSFKKILDPPLYGQNLTKHWAMIYPITHQKRVSWTKFLCNIGKCCPII